MIYNSILDCIGNTPMIKLNHVVPEECAEIFVKYEGLNVGGSIKTRSALSMIEDAERKGLLNKDSIIVEPTSGNQGIGLALIGAIKGYKVKIVLPDSVSLERRKLIKHYGAELLLIHDEGNIGECINKCINKAMELKKNNPNVFVPQQFENDANYMIHENVTAYEILKDVNKIIDGFCSGIGTGGTLTGIGHTLKKANPNIKIWAIEPENASLITNGKVSNHIQMGIGDGIIPKILDRTIYDSITLVSDDEALEMAKNLACKEGLICGISSGTNVVGAIRLGKMLGKGKTVVTILPDTGERYFSTVLFDE